MLLVTEEPVSKGADVLITGLDSNPLMLEEGMLLVPLIKSINEEPNVGSVGLSPLIGTSTPS